MPDYYHPDSDYFRKVLDAPPPTSIPHLTEDEIKEHLKPMLPSKWRLEGNQLIAETENGTHAQTIDPSYICVGTDDKGLPILQRVVLSS